MYRVEPAPQSILCPLCFGITNRHGRQKRRVPHSHFWHEGVIRLELDALRLRFPSCDLTLTHDFGLRLQRNSTCFFRENVVARCHERPLLHVARQYGIPYLTLERWYFDLTSDGVGRVLQIAAPDAEIVVSDTAPSMAKAIESVVSNACHILDRFHLIQFCTEALRRRRKYLTEAKKHHTSRFIDRCMSTMPENLTAEEADFVREWRKEDWYTRVLYHFLQHLRYVLKATCYPQAARHFRDFTARFLAHDCGAAVKIVKTLSGRGGAMIHTIVSSCFNTILEGTYNKFKLIKRRGYGYRNPKRLFHRIILEINVNHRIW